MVGCTTDAPEDAALGALEQHASEGKPPEGWESILTAAYTFVGVADWDNDGITEVLAREDATNNLYSFPGPVTGARNLVFTNQGNKTYAGIANWNSSGLLEIVYRDDTNGDLKVIDHAGTVTTLGVVWTAYTLVDVADWNGDGKIDVIAREDSTGNLWLYPGTGTFAALSTPRQLMGGGFTGYTFGGVANWDLNANLRNDVIAYNAAGDLYMLPKVPGSTIHGTPVQIGNGWTSYDIAGVADWDLDGYVDIIARQNIAPYKLYKYKGTGNAAYPSGATQIGVGF